jgi:hypothetical protein
MIRSLPLLLLCLFFQSSLLAQEQDYCIQGRFSQVPYFAESEVLEMKNITYGWAPRWPSATVDTLRMDVYMPDPALDPLAKRPFIMLIHGGAFYGGQKEDMAALCRDYARRGFVAATMSYRLGWDCNPINPLFVCVSCGPQADKLRVAAYRSVQDSRAALRFAASRAEEWGIDPASFFAGGTSAGSVAAIHAIYLDQETANTFCPGCVTAVGPLDEGVNDIKADYTIRGLINNCGAILLPEALDNAPEIPVISFHDDGDCIVPSDIGWALGCFSCTAFFQGYGSQQIHAYAGTQGTCTELNLRQGSISHCSFPNATVVNRSSCFMKKIFCGSCDSGVNNNINAVEDCQDLGAPVALGDPSPDRPWMRAYPNPARDNLFVDLSGSKGGMLSLFDITGRVVWQAQSISDRRLEIPLSGLPRGLYLLQVNMGGVSEVQKILIQP